MKTFQSITIYVLVLSLCISCNLLYSNCYKKCKDENTKCVLQFLLSPGPPFNLSVEYTTTDPFTRNEVEQNDTFLDSFNSSSERTGNIIIHSTRRSDLINATISSNTDVDIFLVISSNYYITQKNNNGNVTCNLYSRNYYNFQNTNLPDNTFTNLGTLNTTYTFRNSSNNPYIYIICTGLPNSSYHIQVDPIPVTNSDLFNAKVNMYSYYLAACLSGKFHSICIEECIFKD